MLERNFTNTLSCQGLNPTCPLSLLGSRYGVNLAILSLHLSLLKTKDIQHFPCHLFRNTFITLSLKSVYLRKYQAHFPVFKSHCIFSQKLTCCMAQLLSNSQPDDFLPNFLLIFSKFLPSFLPMAKGLNCGSLVPDHCLTILSWPN